MSPIMRGALFFCLLFSVANAELLQLVTSSTDTPVRADASLVLPLLWPTSQGSTLLVVVFSRDHVAATPLGLAFTKAVSATSMDMTAVWHSFNVSAGVGSISVSVAKTTQLTVWVYEYAGLVSIDDTAQQCGTASEQPPKSGALLTSCDSFVIGVITTTVPVDPMVNQPFVVSDQRSGWLLAQATVASGTSIELQSLAPGPTGRWCVVAASYCRSATFFNPAPRPNSDVTANFTNDVFVNANYRVKSDVLLVVSSRVTIDGDLLVEGGLTVAPLGALVIMGKLAVRGTFTVVDGASLIVMALELGNGAKYVPRVDVPPPQGAAFVSQVVANFSSLSGSLSVGRAEQTYVADPSSCVVFGTPSAQIGAASLLVLIPVSPCGGSDASATIVAVVVVCTVVLCAVLLGLFVLHRRRKAAARAAAAAARRNPMYQSDEEGRLTPRFVKTLVAENVRAAHAPTAGAQPVIEGSSTSASVVFYRIDPTSELISSPVVFEETEVELSEFLASFARTPSDGALEGVSEAPQVPPPAPDATSEGVSLPEEGDMDLSDFLATMVPGDGSSLSRRRRGPASLRGAVATESHDQCASNSVSMASEPSYVIPHTARGHAEPASALSEASEPSYVIPQTARGERSESHLESGQSESSERSYVIPQTARGDRT